MGMNTYEALDDSVKLQTVDLLGQFYSMYLVTLNFIFQALRILSQICNSIIMILPNLIKWSIQKATSYYYENPKSVLLMSLFLLLVLLTFFFFQYFSFVTAV